MDQVPLPRSTWPVQLVLYLVLSLLTPAMKGKIITVSLSVYCMDHQKSVSTYLYKAGINMQKMIVALIHSLSFLR